jgi:HD-like signal output (HDOD) protein
LPINQTKGLNATMERYDILKKIAAELDRGEFTFPTHALVALKLQRALDDPDCHTEQATRLIKAEPLLAAKVVALANATAFNPSGRSITDVRTAVLRLGFRYLRSLAASVVARQLAAPLVDPRSRTRGPALGAHGARRGAGARHRPQGNPARPGNGDVRRHRP